MKIEILNRAITEVKVDAIVNNPQIKLIEKIVFVCFDEDNYLIYNNIINKQI